MTLYKRSPKTVQDLFRVSKREWIDGARKAAKDLLRDNYSITIEDVLEAWPLPGYLHRNTIGSVFKDQDFRSIGFERSIRRVCHGRIIRRWRLAHD